MRLLLSYGARASVENKVSKSICAAPKPTHAVSKNWLTHSLQDGDTAADLTDDAGMKRMFIDVCRILAVLRAPALALPCASPLPLLLSCRPWELKKMKLTLHRCHWW